MSPAVDDIIRRRTKRFRAKWAPVRVKKTRQAPAGKHRNRRHVRGGVPHGMKAGDRTADAAHPEIQKSPDCRRPAAHHVFDEKVRLNRHWSAFPNG